MLTNYCWHPRIDSPSGIPVMIYFWRSKVSWICLKDQIQRTTFITKTLFFLKFIFKKFTQFLSPLIIFFGKSWKQVKVHFKCTTRYSNLKIILYTVAYKIENCLNLKWLTLKIFLVDTKKLYKSVQCTTLFTYKIGKDAEFDNTLK